MGEKLEQAISLLSDLIKEPSISREENKTAEIIQKFIESKNIPTTRVGNNILATYQGADAGQPYVLLCSHHDTVKPNSSYSRDPFTPEKREGKLFGLGANDAGGSLVSLILAFTSLFENENKINVVLAAVAEEEISGSGGVTSILSDLPSIDLAIVGEPTQMQMAVAEKGLVVVDAVAKGVPGHAAHSNTVNPILIATEDIQNINKFDFDRISHYLGKTKASVTVIKAGELHNQVPAECHFVIDIRVNEMYTLEEVVSLLQKEVKSQLSPRSVRLKPSGIDPHHPINQVAEDLQIPTFGSSTLSDQALLPFPSIKIGPGDSLRSHTADEFIYLDEIEQGIKKYIQLIEAYSRK